MRESRSRQIEAEVEARRLRVEHDRTLTAMLTDEREFQAKMDELQRVKRAVTQQKEDLKLEVVQQQSDLRVRIERTREAEREVIEQERELAGRESVYDKENRIIALDNERFHE
jgi:hypothetical protein